MKRKIFLLLLSSLLLFTACRSQEVGMITPLPQQGREKEKQQATKVVDDETLKVFFQKYFSVTEEEMLQIHQNPITITGEYWKNYQRYKEVLYKYVGKYLAEEVKIKLESQDVNEDFDLPRKLQLNQYVTKGPQQVEKVEKVATTYKLDHPVYEVVVTTKTKVEGFLAAEKKYRWDESKGYYIACNDAAGNTFNNGQFPQDPKHYLYTEKEEDVLRLQHHYWVEISPKDTLAVVSVKEASNLHSIPSTRKLATNTSHVTRLPFREKPLPNEKQLITTVLTSLVYQPKDFYTYYEKSMNSNYEVFKQLMENDLHLKDKVRLESLDYQDAFEKNYTLYLDDFIDITIPIDAIQIQGSKYSSDNQSQFIVTLPIEGVTMNGQKITKQYCYRVGIENNKVEFVHFMYNNLSAEKTYQEKEEVSTQKSEEKEA